jgi:hypothetical protein
MRSEMRPPARRAWFTTPISGLKIQRQMRAITTVGTM